MKEWTFLIDLYELQVVLNIVYNVSLFVKLYS